MSAISLNMERWMHRKIAEDVSGNGIAGATLEIGAGTLNHLQYEPNTDPYDIVEPVSDLYESSTLIERIRNIYQDISEIPLYKKYERIISIATFEHICNLPEVVAKVGLLLDSVGQLRVAIPSEGTILWTLGWKLTTGIEFRLRYGLDYGVLMKHEHINNAKEIDEILEYFFASIKKRVLGINKTLSFYRFIVCTIPHVKRCSDYLETIT